MPEHRQQICKCFTRPRLSHPDHVSPRHDHWKRLSLYRCRVKELLLLYYCQQRWVEACLIPVHDGFRASDATYFDVSHFSAVVFNVFIGHLLEFAGFDVEVLLDFFHFEVRFRSSTEDFLSHLNLFLRLIKETVLDLLFLSSYKFLFFVYLLINWLIYYFVKSLSLLNLLDLLLIFCKESIQRIDFILIFVQRGLSFYIR